MRKLFLRHAMAIVLALAVFPSGPAIAGAPQQDQHKPQAQTPQSDQKMQGPNMDEMVARKKANTDRIAALMLRVNATRGDEKIAAMADVIAILVEERTAMQEHCAAMCGTMHK